MEEQDITKILTLLTAKNEEMERRIKILEENIKNIQKLTTAVEVLTEKNEYAANNIQDIAKKIDSIESIPGKRWEALIGYIASSIIGALITFMITAKGG